MNKRQIFVVLSVMSVILLTLFSCNLKVSDQNELNINDNRIEKEMERLTSQAELDNFVTRGDDNIVDWQLSREFAELWLENGIEVNRYPSTSQLWDLPVAIYSSDGVIKYYEFRVVDNNNVIGYITGTATKDYSCPILYEGHFDGFYDEITELYNSGKLSSDNIPRIVDDLYPNVKIGVTTDTKGDSVDFNTYLDVETGDEVNKEDIKEYISYFEALEKCPEMIPEELDHNKILEIIENDQKQAEEFWNMAVANKGHIADFATRGTAKPITAFTEEGNYCYSLEENQVDSRDFTHIIGGDRFKEYWKKLYPNNLNYFRGINNYGPCGPVAEGFVIDFLVANNLIDPTQTEYWNSLTRSERVKVLKREMACTPILNGEATWPWNIGDSIKLHTPYRTSLSLLDFCCSNSIDNGLPGIDLRILKDEGGFHYRAIIGYEKPGWFIFKWDKMKIIDLIDCDSEYPIDRFKGKWETFAPIYHLLRWNVVKK